jgi:uncharacterized iron-regulated protein
MQNFSLLLWSFALVLLTACSRPPTPLQHTIRASCTVYDMKQAACISEAELVRRLAPYRVVFMGDYHTSETMHSVFAGLLSALGQNGRHVMLANEWFTPEDDALLARYADGTFDGNFTKAIGWKKKAGYPFASYEPIYHSVMRQGGMLYGVNMDKAFEKAISDANLSAMTAGERSFYEQLDLNLTAHRTMLEPFFSHCHARHAGEDDRACLQRMYRVQVAWDTYMGEQSALLAKRLLKRRRDLLVVFAGAMHLDYGIGINARFARRSREPFVTILPTPSGMRSVDVGEADYLLFFKPGSSKKNTP